MSFVVFRAQGYGCTGVRSGSAENILLSWQTQSSMPETPSQAWTALLLVRNAYLYGSGSRYKVRSESFLAHAKFLREIPPNRFCPLSDRVASDGSVYIEDAWLRVPLFAPVRRVRLFGRTGLRPVAFVSRAVSATVTLFTRARCVVRCDGEARWPDVRFDSEARWPGCCNIV